MTEGFEAFTDEISGFQPNDAKSAIKAKLPNLMNAVTIICIIIAAIVSLGDVTFTLNSIWNISVLVAIIYFITSLVYRNNYCNGMNAAKKSDEYKRTLEEYQASKSEIYKRGAAPRLAEYCARYREEELKHYRKSLLQDVGINYETFVAEYLGLSRSSLKKKGVPRAFRRLVKRASRAKGIRITSDVILSEASGETHRRKGLGMSGVARQNIDFGLNIASRGFSVLLAGAFAVNVIIEPSWHTLAQWAIRMLPVLWAALVAYNAGTRNILETTIPYVRRKTEILKIFLSWHEREE